MEVLVTGQPTTGGDSALLEGTTDIVDGLLAVRAGGEVFIPVFSITREDAVAEFDLAGQVSGWVVPGPGELIRLAGGESDSIAGTVLPEGADKFWVVAPKS